jgi:hypothetical protein
MGMGNCDKYLRSQVLTRDDHIFTLHFPTTSKEASSSKNSVLIPIPINFRRIPVRRLSMLGVLALSVASTLSFSGCGGGATEGNLKPGVTITPEQSAEKAKAVMKGMEGQYKGAPGVPASSKAK